MLDISCPLKTPLFCICSKKRKKKNHHTSRVIFPKIFVSARYPIQSYPLDNARTCGELFPGTETGIARLNTRDVFSTNWNSLVEILACFAVYCRSNFHLLFLLSFLPFTPPPFLSSLSLSLSLSISPLRLRAPPRGLSKRLLPRARERERERERTR